VYSRRVIDEFDGQFVLSQAGVISTRMMTGVVSVSTLPIPINNYTAYNIHTVQ